MLGERWLIAWPVEECRFASVYEFGNAGLLRRDDRFPGRKRFKQYQWNIVDQGWRPNNFRQVDEVVKVVSPAKQVNITLHADRADESAQIWELWTIASDQQMSFGVDKVKNVECPNRLPPAAL